MIIAFLVLTNRWNVCRIGSSGTEYIGSALLAAIEGSFELGALIWLLIWLLA